MAGNCPNCGAPIDGIECGYCGTAFVDFAAMSVSEPFYMKVKHPGGTIIAKVLMDGMSVEYRTHEMPVIDARFYAIDLVREEAG